MPQTLTGPDVLVGYRRLAVRVIQQALRDLDSPDPHLRQSAQAFLTGDTLLVLWCDLAEIGPSRVIARAAQWQPRPRRPGTPGRPALAQASGTFTRLASANASVS